MGDTISSTAYFLILVQSWLNLKDWISSMNILYIKNDATETLLHVQKSLW